MGLIYKVIWNDYEIGEISDLKLDMCYIDAIWTPFHTHKSVEFEQQLKTIDPKSFIQNPANAAPVILQNIAEPASILYCLAFCFDGKQLSLKQIISDEALDIYFPAR